MLAYSQETYHIFCLDGDNFFFKLVAITSVKRYFFSNNLGIDIIIGKGTFLILQFSYFDFLL